MKSTITLLFIAVLAAILSTTTGRSLISNQVTSKLMKNRWPPHFCNDLDCPKYSLINDTKKTWEERLYVESNWVGTSMSGESFSDAREEMFMRLFAYIEGANEKGIKIPMAAPVIVKSTVDKSQTAKFYSNFTMFFYLPYAYQNTTAPQPTSKDVFLWTMPESRMFVRSFGGYDNEKKDIDNSQILAKDLKGQWPYNKGYMYIAGYNSPWQILDRHNEIWFVGTN